MIFFKYPIWFAFLIPVLTIFFLRKNYLRTQNLLSLLFFLSLIIALAQPYIEFSGDNSLLIVLDDRSSSMPEDAEKRKSEIIAKLEKIKDKNEIIVIGFAEKIFIEKNISDEVFSEFRGNYNGSASDLGTAIKTDLSLVPSNIANWKSKDKLSAKIAETPLGTSYCFVSFRDRKGRNATILTGAVRNSYPRESRPKKIQKEAQKHSKILQKSAVAGKEFPSMEFLIYLLILVVQLQPGESLRFSQLSFSSSKSQCAGLILPQVLNG